MKLSDIFFEGIILQPISRKKTPWTYYDKSKNNFLDFFQKAFREDIQDYFNVNHNTKSFSDYLLIPYFVEDNKQCFGAYFIKSGERSSDEGFTWKYNIDYDKSFDFKKAIPKQELLNEAEFNGINYHEVGHVDYYEIKNISSDFRKFIIELAR